ncbi:hypothetical protein A3A75_01545 [Candidatus Woesebacteria bacterium RIFCSPLOWO2_01_FULL_39_10]|uniref:LcnD-like C-terminal domain-containing protein n=1 Tax=Candidatus Woesebacteria bacterium RIFCSPLOWO2_01_FULL_39_10 TaxID=1802516 RepID=A0A1F8B8S3_9BACT|nr:MAG: hypothetical protein A3A75_01545 [Candidatus Woesebacteria bacterium RIFCSPLOWO2_01_FULL_39_10]
MDDKRQKPNILRRIFKTRRRLILVLVIIVVAILGARFIVSGRNGEVETARVYKGTVQEELILSGEIRAEEHASLSFLSSGELNFVGVAEGQVAKKGEVLAKLDSTNTQQTFLQAESDLRRYDASLAKTYDDVQGHENDESFNQRETRTIAETNRDKAYRAYVIARKNLTSLSLKAPFDGVVTNITHPFTGINTTLTESQIEIVNPKTIYFAVSADQSEVTDLKIGQKVKVVLDPFSDEEIEGEVIYISFTPKSGEVGTIYEVKVKLSSNINIQKVRIGMSGDAKFILIEKDAVLFVPPNFVKTDAKGRYVNLGKKNNKVYVKTGLEGEKRIEIKGDIKEGDMVYD